MLPVDIPDAEHAIASTTANAASFTKKADDARPLPVALTCLKVAARGGSLMKARSADRIDTGRALENNQDDPINES